MPKPVSDTGRNADFTEIAMQTQDWRSVRMVAPICLGLLLAGTTTLGPGCSSHSRGLGGTGGTQGGNAGAGGSVAGGAAASSAGGASSDGGRMAGGASAAGGTVAAGGTTPASTSSSPGLTDPVSLERGGNFGACVQQGQFRDAVIRPDSANGGLVLTGSIHRSANITTGEADPVGPIALTSEQIVQFQTLVAALPPAPCPTVSLGCDTCWGTTVTIGTRRYVDNMCERCDYASTVNAIGAFIDSLGAQDAATLDGGTALADAAGPDRVSSLDGGGPDLDRDASWDAPLPRLDASHSFPELFEGIWLFGWSGGSNHFSWIRFSALSPATATDPPPPGYGTVDILEGKDAVNSNLGFWACSGQGRWFITQMPNTISIELPAGCPSSSPQAYTVTAIQEGPAAFLRPGSSQRVVLARGALTPIEAFRYPDGQCDAAMTTCTPVEPVTRRDAAAP